MFNAEKLLGGLLCGGSRRSSGLGSLISGGVALGFAGVAMEAVEHFMKKSETSQSGGLPPGPAPGRASAAPPPPPGATAPAPLPPPQAPGAIPKVDASEGNQDTVLLIRAMIAAANADGMIDEKERERILGKLKAADLSDEEQSFIVDELVSPAEMESIINQVQSPEMAKQVYTVSLLAIEVDTDAECTYMNTLAQRLGLDESAINNIQQKLGIEKP